MGLKMRYITPKVLMCILSLVFLNTMVNLNNIPLGNVSR